MALRVYVDTFPRGLLLFKQVGIWLPTVRSTVDRYCLDPQLPGLVAWDVR